MLIKAAGGFAHGTKLTARRPPQREMVVIARAGFTLKPGEPVALRKDLGQKGYLSGDVFADGDDEREKALVRASDFADWLPAAEVLLAATCWPGQGRKAYDCTVKVRVGEWSKTARVFGRRVWTERALSPISDPAPFLSMPLDWTTSFGGPSFAKNPVGKGWKTEELPTVESPNALLRSKRDKPDPVGFGPINPSWPPRAGKTGKEYGADWRKTRAPFVSQDFDWTFFHAAPEDQRLGRYLRGDEDLAFDFMHPDATRFEARLPGVLPRAFVRYQDGSTVEVGMNLDTLFADLDEGLLFLTWRGLVPVAEDDFADVRTLVIGSDSLERPKPASDWMAQVDEHEADPQGMKTAVSDAMKAKIAEARAQMDAAPQMPDTPSPEQARADPWAVLGERLGRAVSDRPPDEQAQAFQALSSLKARADAVQAARAAAASDAPVPPTVDVYAQAEQALDAKRALVTSPDQLARLDDAKAQLAKAKQMHVEADASMAQAAANSNGAFEAPPATATAIPTDVAKIASPPARNDAPGPRAKLKNRDLSGQDLSGKDLGGAQLRGAKLAGASLAGASLLRADLGGADLSGADLSGADLTQANLTGARVSGARLAKTKLHMTILARADLAGADLSEADVRMAVFLETQAAGATFRGAKMHKAFFSKGTFDQADFSEASLDVCVFSGVAMPRAIFERATLNRVGFLQADLAEATFAESKGKASVWLGGKLDGATFHSAALERVHFRNASMERADLTQAILVGARFYRAKLEHALFVAANLRQADLTKSVLGETSFEASNLYGAKFFGVEARAKCDFAGANMKGVRWDKQG